MNTKSLMIGCGAALLSASVWAGSGHEGHGELTEDAHAHATPDAHVSVAGKPGRPDQVTRTIHVEALDTMRFKHEPIQVTAGETIRFHVMNQGQVLHEFALGSTAEHTKHRQQMREMPDMKHEDPNVVMLEPGESKALVWTFAKATEIQAACNVPGHYEAGMYSEIEVK